MIKPDAFILALAIQIVISQNALARPAKSVEVTGVLVKMNEKTIVIESAGNQFEVPKTLLKGQHKTGERVYVAMSSKEAEELKPVPKASK